MRQTINLILVAVLAVLPCHSQTEASERTKAELMDDFRDGQGRNTITPRKMRNLVESIEPLARNLASVKTYGAVGDNVTDDTAEIQACIDDRPDTGGACFFPAGSYITSGSIVVKDNVTLVGEASSFGSSYQSRIFGSGGTGNFPVIYDGGDQKSGVSIDGIQLRGTPASGSRGIYAPNRPLAWRITNVSLDWFGDECIKMGATGTEGVDGLFKNNFAVNCLLVRTGRSAYVGALDFGVHDARIESNEASASVYYSANCPQSCTPQATYPGQGLIGDGYIAAIVNRGANALVYNNIAQISQVGLVLLGDGPTQVSSNRADLNQGAGFVVAAYGSTLIGNNSYRNSMTADAAYSGFETTGGYEIFIGNRTIQATSVDSGATGYPRMQYGFKDTSAGDSALAAHNYYFGNRETGTVSGEYTFSGSTLKFWDYTPVGRADETNGIPWFLGGALVADRDKLTFDTLNTRLGIGTNTPQDGVHVFSSVGHAGALLETSFLGGVAAMNWHDNTASTNAKYWVCRTVGAADRFQCAAQSDNFATENPFLLIQRSGSTLTYTALPSRVLVGTTTDDSSAALVVNGKVRTSTAFASLGTPNNGVMTWCTDCNVASPCTGSGGGAWAFRTGGAWNCPF